MKEGTTVALPNDPTNQARALVLLDQLGWIKLRDKYRSDPRVGKRHRRQYQENQADAAGSGAAAALAAGHRLLFRQRQLRAGVGPETDRSAGAEKISPNYVNLVAVRTADKDKQFAKDIAAAYRSREFLEVTNKHFADYAKTDYQLALQKPPSK